MSNWDVMEGVLDSTFVGLGVDGAEGGINRPVLMTEPLANLGYSRKSWVSLDLPQALLILYSND